jgi:hypothetical protein
MACARRFISGGRGRELKSQPEADIRLIELLINLVGGSIPSPVTKSVLSIEVWAIKLELPASASRQFGQGQKCPQHPKADVRTLIIFSF